MAADRSGDALSERIGALLARSPFPSDLKMSLREASRGRAVVEMPWEPRLRQYQGILHGGAAVALLDTTATMAFVTALAPGEDIVTIELKVNYLSPVAPREAATASGAAGGGGATAVRSEAREIHHGRRTRVAEAEVFSLDGRCAVKGLVTAMVIPAAP